MKTQNLIFISKRRFCALSKDCVSCVRGIAVQARSLLIHQMGVKCRSDGRKRRALCGCIFGSAFRNLHACLGLYL